jgi:calcium channel MID1
VTATNAPTAVSAVPRTTDAPRNKGSSYPTYPFNYDEMLPCISVCTLVERKCPPNLQWACPHRNFNAKDSYAFIGPDTHHGDGTAARGYPAQDVWGNRWCSG